MIILVKYEFPSGAVFKFATGCLVKFQRDLWMIDYHVNRYNYLTLRETFVVYQYEKYARHSYEKFIADFGDVAYIHDGYVSF